MVTSTQLTQRILQHPNPEQAEQEMWAKTRYLIAQKPASKDFTGTQPGHYKGRLVIPGPKANPKLSDRLSNRDLPLLKSRHFIRFVNNRTTDNAQESVQEALFTIMTKAEADDYEAKLKQHKEGGGVNPIYSN